MKRIKHTTGPWEAEHHRERPSDPGWWTIDGRMVGRDGVVADTLNRDCTISPEEDEANARIIALAPALYAFARDIRDNSDCECYGDRSQPPCHHCEAGKLLANIEATR